MQTFKNYYFILGVSRNASSVEIEAAYESRKAAAAFDEFQASMMYETTEAYECLSDRSRRMEYDSSLGEPPQLSPTSGNVHNFRSAESAVSLEIALNKERKKRKLRRQIFKNIVMTAIFLAVAGIGIKFGIKYFKKGEPIQEPLAELFQVTKTLAAPQPESPPPVSQPAAKDKPLVHTYNIQSGGVVTADNSRCRSQPSYNAGTKAMMRKDTVIFATKEVRDKDGSVWYYVSNSQFEGWANGRDVRIYKF
jgi:curved DNA-binding protein CbpA